MVAFLIQGGIPCRSVWAYEIELFYCIFNNSSILTKYLQNQANYLLYSDLYC